MNEEPLPLSVVMVENGVHHCNACSWSVDDIEGWEYMARLHIESHRRDHETVSNPFSALVESSMSMHEVFRSWIDGGFTEDQALRLLAYTIRAGASEDD